LEIKDIISSGLLEMHVTGIATAQESAQVMKWAEQYPEVKAELDNIEIAMEFYAMAHAVEPAAGLKETILQEAFKKNNPTPPIIEAHKATIVSISPVWKYLAAASIVLLIGSALLNLRYYDQIQKTSTAYEHTQQELLAVNERMKALDEDMGVVKNKYSQPVSLNGLPAAPDAEAKVFWIKNTGDIYLDPSNLPEAPAGKQYQLWGIVDGKPVDAGLIITTKENNKYRILKMKSFGKLKVQAFAVTLETAGGNPTPKGEMYVLGEL
jgi:Anti-sigma-K factor rskA